MEKDAMNRKPVGTREWYDFVGDLSGALPGLHLGGQDATRTLLEVCQIDATSRVLDVGCGSGNTACLIAEQYGAHVHGIDISKVMIAKAEERARWQGLAEKVEFQVADVFELPFEENTFDVVLVESVLIPLPGDKKQALVEMIRVVRPGGRIGANESTVDPAAPKEFLELLAEHPGTYGRFTPQTLRLLFEESGLDVVHLVEAKSAEAPNVLQQLGCGGLLSFMFRVYPKILLKLLRDARFRRASQIDDEVTKRGKEHMGYTLIVGRKPGS